MYCYHCGASNEQNNKICVKCGEDLIGTGILVPTSGPKNASKPADRAAATNVVMINQNLMTCPACHLLVAKTASSCPFCGQPIRPAKSTGKTVGIAVGWTASIVSFLAVSAAVIFGLIIIALILSGIFLVALL